MQNTQTSAVTRLSFLTRDGGLEAEFSPALEDRHYVELFDIVKEFDSELVARMMLLDAAMRWGRRVNF